MAAKKSYRTPELQKIGKMTDLTLGKGGTYSPKTK